MAITEERPAWQILGHCRGVHATLRGRHAINFFPHKGESSRAAREVCKGCPVRVDCLNYALDNPNGTTYGIWGGTTERQRKLIRRAGALKEEEAISA